MKLIIVRHGETEGNANKIHQHAETPLNGRGRAQARAAASVIARRNIDRVYVSDFRRTRETAEEILKFHPSIPTIFTSELRERNVSIFIGRPHGELTLVREASGLPFHEFRPEGGESFRDLQKRVIAFYKKIIGQHREGTTLFVTHHGVKAVLLLHLMGKSFDDFDSLIIGNTAITVVDIDESGRHVIEVLNSTEHVEEIMKVLKGKSLT